MGLNVRGIGIHGTPDASSIGYSRSHGCVRLLPREAEWLFRRVRVGTPVLIVAAQEGCKKRACSRLPLSEPS